VLRSGVFKLLVGREYKLVIFINCRRMPEYIKEEFKHPNVTLIPIGEFPVGKIHRKFIEFTHLLLYTKTTKRYFRYSRHFLEKNRIIVFFHLLAMRVSSALKFLKPLSRKIESVFFKEVFPSVEGYFDVYKPDLLFSTSITSKHDNIFMKAAKRRGIKTVSMPKSWDTVTKMYYRFIPDYFIVQNEHLKRELINLQDVPADKIFVSGFPQFDWYKKEEIIRPREEHFKKMGLDPKLPLILFGSQGSWYDKDYKVAEKIYEWVAKDELVKPTQILFRPHFSNVKTNEFRKYQGMPRAAYDASYHVSDDFRDNWDPTTPETIDFVNSIAHADVVVIVLSTLALDAACRDKPVINIVFGSRYRKGVDITPLMQYSNHYEWVFDTNATFRARNFLELKGYINTCLLDPSVKKKEREELRNKVCYKVDGGASLRIVEVLDKVLHSNNYEKSK
jgi:CDP-glycerol glycerophosphotransferase (TagB/SpsB family)